MYKNYLNFFLFIVVIFSITSCVNTRKATYFNDTVDAVVIPNAADVTLPVIQKNDILSIVISSLNEEASKPFNMGNNAGISTVTSAGGNQSALGYLVGTDGNIQLPTLGTMKVAGLTTKQVRDAITAILIEKKLLLDPIVTIRHLNYEITVIGEVGRPAVINVPSEKISLLKAIGLAGDITVYGKKDNVLLIREISGKRTVKRIDLNSTDFLSSPYYYLQPNDVVYVETNKNKLASVSSVKQTLPIVLSALSVLLITLDRILR
jgi:polysaccharide export outer membrane protein